MSNILLISQIILSVIISGAILLQAQGSGFGSTWSGGGETYHTRRGLEKVIFYFTIVAILAFAAVSLTIVIL
jgi:protein translocase SecG subunit